jgi:carbamoyl-phosphate synthase small subunit
MAGADLVSIVTPKDSTTWTEGLDRSYVPLRGGDGAQRLVVAIDCGMKRNILRHLIDLGCRVRVMPPTSSAAEILEEKPGGVFVSNGPGDPAAVSYAIDLLKALIGRVPLFGICLGHQLLGLALGAATFKMKFGHRGGNHPVQSLASGRVEITSQNHGFALDRASLEEVGGLPTHVNLNDQTLEGFVHRDMPILAIQYHPEASPGPHDATYLFDCFAAMMTTGKSPTGEDLAGAQAALQRRHSAQV